MTKILMAALCSGVWVVVACSGVVPTEIQRATDSIMGSDATPGTCCINEAEFYDCPNGRTTSRCGGLGLPLCMSNCGTDQSCQERCLQTDAPNPSECTRNTARDAECAAPQGTGTGTGS